MKIEIDTHRWLTDPGVPALRDVVFTQKAVHLVFDYGGPALLGSVRPLTDAPALRSNFEVAQAAGRAVLGVFLKLNAAGVSYNDMKPDQLLCTMGEGGPEVKLVDFGGGAFGVGDWEGVRGAELLH